MGKQLKTLLSLLVVLLPASILAQTGSIKGIVTDKKTGETMFGTTIIVRGTSSGAATDIDGKYEIKNLRHGVYTLEVRMVGYQTTLITDVKVVEGQTTEKNIQLHDQTLDLDVVEVVGEKPLIDESPHPTNTIGGDQIKEAPVRQIQNIINTQPGVVNTQAGIFIRGGRTYETGFLIDGVSAKDPLAGTGFGIDIGSNALSEIDINTGGASADVGDATSGVVNAKTKSGGDSLEISVSHKRDNFGFNKDWQSSWNSQLTEITIGGSSKWIFPKNPRKLRYFVALRGFFTDQFTKNPPNQLRSSLYPQTAVTPYLDNRWSGILKLNYDIDSTKRLSITYNKTISANQDQNMLRITGNDVPFTPGYQFLFQNQMDNANTYTHDANLTIINFKHLLRKNLNYEITGSRFFARLRSDANGRDWRPAVVNSEFDPNSIVTYPVTPYNPGDSVVFVNPAPGLYNNGGIATLWHDHYIEEYTLKAVGNLFKVNPKDNSLNRLSFGAEVKLQDLQWIDVGQPWVGAPIQTANGGTTQSYRLGYYSEIWRVKPSRGGVFVTDKVRYKGLIAEVGARFEYWMPGKYVDDAIKDPNSQIRPEIRQDYLNSSTEIFGRRFKFRFLPKIAASFPIGTKQMLFFNYAHSTILPHPSYVYTGLNPYYSDRSTVARLGNPNLNPEVSISYELGLKTEITSNDALTTSAYWRDNYDFITTTSVLVKDVTGREVSRSLRINSDYARIRGIEVGYLKRIGKWYQGQFSVAYMVATGQSSSASSSLKEILGEGNREDTREFSMPWSSPWDVKMNHVFILNKKGGYLGKKWFNHMAFYIEGVWRTGTRYTPYEFQGNEVSTGRPIYIQVQDPNQRYSKIGKSTWWFDFNFRKWWTVKKVQLSWTIEVTNIFNIKNTARVNPVTGRAWQSGDPVPTEWRDPSYPDPRDPRSSGTPPNDPSRYMAQRHFMTGISVKF
jgi:outer membrane receptor protein involved in Fe transport